MERLSKFNRVAVSNEDVIRMYLSGNFPEDKMPTWGTTNLKITKRTNGWSLVNYSTPLLYHSGSPSTAEWMNTPFSFNKTKYSVTTSTIQNKIRSIAEQVGVSLDEIEESSMPSDSRIYRRKRAVWPPKHRENESEGEYWETVEDATFNYDEFRNAVGRDIPFKEMKILWDDFLNYESDALSANEHIENWMFHKLPEKYANKRSNRKAQEDKKYFDEDEFINDFSDMVERVTGYAPDINMTGGIDGSASISLEDKEGNAIDLEADLYFNEEDGWLVYKYVAYQPTEDDNILIGELSLYYGDLKDAEMMLRNALGQLDVEPANKRSNRKASGEFRNSNRESKRSNIKIGAKTIR